MTQEQKWRIIKSAGMVAAAISTYATFTAGLQGLWRIVGPIVSFLIFLALAIWALDMQGPLLALPKAWKRKCTIYKPIVSIADQIGREWRRYLTSGDNPNIWAIRTSVARSYLGEELKDIDRSADFETRHMVSEEARLLGDGRPMLVSNFLNYSEIVRGVIESASADLGDSADRTVLFFTTQPLPLTKWFNFDGTRYVQPGWADYLTFLQDVVERFEHDERSLVLARCLLVAQDGDHAENCHLMRNRTIEELGKEASSWVWIPQGTTKLMPLRRYENPGLARADQGKLANQSRQYVANTLGPKLGANHPVMMHMDEYYDDDRPSYLIFPSEDLTAAQDKSRLGIGRFRRLGDIFCQRFHSSHKDKRLAYFGVPTHPDFYEDDYAEITIEAEEHRVLREPAVPGDLFFVGTIDTQGLDVLVSPQPRDMTGLGWKGLFCLCASVDEQLETIHCYLLDPESTPKHFATIDSYALDLLANATLFEPPL